MKLRSLCVFAYFISLPYFIFTYTIEYDDCSNPESLRKYDTTNICELDDEDIYESEEEYEILQVTKFEDVDGFKCEVTKSSFSFYCGAYSHQKFVEVPTIEVSLEVSKDECEYMVRKKEYKTEDGTLVPIKLNEENVFKVNDLGIIHTDTSVPWCEGQTVKFKDNLMDNILIISQYKVEVIQENYKLELETKNLMVTNDHITLPCKYELGVCALVGATYIWKHRLNDACPLQKVRSIKAKHIKNHWLMDKENKIILKTFGRFEAWLPGCPTVEIINTEYDDLKIVKKENGKKFPKFDDDIEISTYVKAIAEYVLWDNNEKLRQEKRKWRKRICVDNNNQIKPNELMRIGESEFQLLKGNQLMIMKCKRKTATIVKVKECFENSVAIKQPNGQIGYVDVTKRVLQEHKIEAPCNSHFPLVVKCLEGWIAVDPELKKINSPDKMELNEHNDDEPELLDEGGIYTKDEFNAWMKLIKQRNYNQELTRKINIGLEKEYTRSKTPVLNLKSIVEEGWENLDWRKKLRTFIEDKAVYFLIGIEIIRFLKWVIITSLQVKKDGVGSLRLIMFNQRRLIPEMEMEKLEKTRKLNHFGPNDDLEVFPLTWETSNWGM